MQQASDLLPVLSDAERTAATKRFCGGYGSLKSLEDLRQTSEDCQDPDGGPEPTGMRGVDREAVDIEARYVSSQVFHSAPIRSVWAAAPELGRGRPPTE